MELDIIAAKDFIAGKFRNAGDFDFIPDEQLEEIISALTTNISERLLKTIRPMMRNMFTNICSNPFRRNSAGIRLI